MQLLKHWSLLIRIFYQSICVFQIFAPSYLRAGRATSNKNLCNPHMNAFTLLIPNRENSSHPLAKFEALLSITNLLSCGPVEQDRFVSEQ